MDKLHAIDGDGEQDDPLETLLIEHERMVTLAMGGVDLVLIEQQQETSPAINVAAVKQALAKQLRRSIAARNRALAELGLSIEQAEQAIARLGNKGSAAYVNAVWSDADEEDER